MNNIYHFLNNSRVRYILYFIIYCVGWALFDLVRYLFRKIRRHTKQAIKVKKIIDKTL